MPYFQLHYHLFWYLRTSADGVGFHLAQRGVIQHSGRALCIEKRSRHCDNTDGFGKCRCHDALYFCSPCDPHAIRYTARKPVALERLEEDANGDLVRAFSKLWSNGTTDIKFSPVALLGKLTAFVPLMRIHPLLVEDDAAFLHIGTGEEEAGQVADRSRPWLPVRSSMYRRYIHILRFYCVMRSRLIPMTCIWRCCCPAKYRVHSILLEGAAFLRACVLRTVMQFSASSPVGVLLSPAMGKRWGADEGLRTQYT